MSEMDNRTRNRNEDFATDEPVYSRLFVLFDRKLTREDLDQAFSEFGHIEDIKIPLDQNGRPKGVCFIKFSKTSEAAAALEAMDASYLPNSYRALKVMVAVNRSEVQNNDNDMEKYKRLFLHVPRRMTEKELEDIFSKYGKLRAVTIQREHNTGDSKGFAYVSYGKFSEAARAFEECERQYRPVFAKPKTQRRPETSFESNIGMLDRTAAKTSLLTMMANQSYNQTGFTKVNYMCCPQLRHWQIQKLFDLIPGMIDCQFFMDLMGNCIKGTVSYSNPTSAAYAVEKLNEFEYPPGMAIYVKPNTSKFGPEENQFKNIPGAVSKLKNAIEKSTSSGSGAPNLAELAEAIAEASKLIKAATGGVEDSSINSNDINYCSVNLPPPQPLAHIDSEVAKRCFLICKPTPPPLTVLRDVFCRFGDLINVYTLPNKTVGYARYASAAAADEAIKVLHGAEVYGVRMKVLEAEAEAPPRKRKFNE